VSTPHQHTSITTTGLHLTLTMPLRDMLKKKDKRADTSVHDLRPDSSSSQPEFTFLRTTTYSEEVITPPTYPDNSSHLTEDTRRRFSKLGFGSRPRATSGASNNSAPASRDGDSSRKRLSQRLHLKREVVSANVPSDLPAIEGSADGEQAERQWEKRATILARSNGMIRSRPGSPERSIGQAMGLGIHGQGMVGSGEGVVADRRADDNIQEAIRLHEEGDLEQATRMFGRLADPGGENNALSQVLYGLALRLVGGSSQSLSSVLGARVITSGKSSDWNPGLPCLISIPECQLMAHIDTAGVAKQIPRRQCSISPPQPPTPPRSKTKRYPPAPRRAVPQRASWCWQSSSLQIRLDTGGESRRIRLLRSRYVA